MRHRLVLPGLLLLAAAVITSGSNIKKETSAQIVGSPPAGKIYHGVYPGGMNQPENSIVKTDLEVYQQAVGKKAAWVYVPNNWSVSRSFPLATADWVRQNGSIPFIRLMLRSSEQNNVAEPTFTLDRIIGGEFDEDLRAWARSAKEFKTPLLAEYGTEVNGKWFPWNGIWNDKAAGPEKFKQAYRHIVQIMREEKADNVLWVFHVNDRDDPAQAWNRFENYYPGDEWIDWLGLSVYGPQKKTGWNRTPFRKLMDKAYGRLVKLNPDKPIALLEFGITDNNWRVNQSAWADKALKDLVNRRWPRLIGFAWWNEAWQNGNDPADITNMRVQDNPALAKVFEKWVGRND
ncbi:MAG: glycosyl hydrolase, partial [Candidatus Margulisbacteria bacterium]|nr:glycosyl hydrolase [Candidatus Margulisiibacteriota bacterium]